MTKLDINLLHNQKDNYLNLFGRKLTIKKVAKNIIQSFLQARIYKHKAIRIMFVNHSNKNKINIQVYTSP
jgi:hypothetical protein